MKKKTKIQILKHKTQRCNPDYDGKLTKHEQLLALIDKPIGLKIPIGIKNLSTVNGILMFNNIINPYYKLKMYDNEICFDLDDIDIIHPNGFIWLKRI